MPSIDGNTSMMQNLLNCPFEVKERSPCDRLYRLISVEEDSDGTVTMVLESAEENSIVMMELELVEEEDA